MCGGGKGVQQTSQQTAYPSWPAAIGYSNAMDRISAATSKPFQKYSSDPEAYVAGLNPTQQGAIANVTGMQGMTDPYFQGATGLTMAGAGPVGRLTSGQIQEYMNPYMSAVVDPVKAALGQQFGQQLSQQQTQAIKAGGFEHGRSAVDRALLQGQQGLALGQALSPLYSTGYGQALQTAQGQQGVEAANLQRLLGAGAQIGGLGTAAQNAALQQASAQLQGGTLQQQTETAQKQALYNEFQKERMYPLQTAQLYAQAAGGLGPLMGSTSMGYQQMPFFGGFAAHGGAIKGYDEGVGAARMGGAVIDLEPGKDYWRGGYADGGAPGFEDIVARHKAAITPVFEEVAFPTADIRPAEQLRPNLPQQQQSGGLGSMLTKGAELGKLGLQVREARKAHPDSWMDTMGSIVTGKAEGGEVDQDAMSSLLANPIKASQPLQPEAPKKKESGGLGGLLKAGASLAANYFMPGSGAAVSGGLSALGMADGGRAGYATDGGVRPSYDPELDYMARTMIKEAGDQGDTGMAAVGHVGMNRLLSGRYGKSLQDVFTAPKQFSPWNVEARGTRADPRLIDPSSSAYQHAYDIARRVQSGEIEDPTGGATHFYAQKLVNPKWARGVDPTAVIGGHTFMRADAGADQDALGKALSHLPPGAREMRATYPERPTTEAPGPSAGLGSAQVKDKSFMERTQEHPESLILPILQGLGAMAGSKNRYAMGAMLEGIGAGAGSYMDMAAKQAEIDKIRQGTATEAEETQAKSNLAKKILSEKGLLDVQTAAGAIHRDPEGNPIDALVFDANGESHWVPFTQIMENPAAYNLTPGVAREVELQKQGGARTGATGATNPPPEPLKLQAAPPIPVGVGWGGRSSEDAAKGEYSGYLNSADKAQLKDSSRKYIGKVKADAAAAEDDRFFTNQIAHVIGQAAQDQLLSAPGAGAQWRANLVGALNTIVKSIPGMEDAGNVFGDIKERSELLEKLNQLRGMQQVGSAQERSLGALERQLSAMPQLWQDPKASSANIASQIVQNRMRLDRLDHLNRYTQYSKGLANNAETDFIRNNKAEKYGPAQKAIQSMLTDPGGYVDAKDPSKGYIPPGWKVYESLESGQIDAKTIEEYFKRLALKNRGTEGSFSYTPGISRFFGEGIYAQ